MTLCILGLGSACVAGGNVPYAAGNEQPISGSPDANPNMLSPQNPNVAGSANFVIVAPKAYVGKLKTLLTGQAASDDDVTTGSSDSGLASLVETWLQTPAADDALLAFFTLAFQQQDQSPNDNIYDITPSARLQQAMRETMARTALDTVKRDAPFNSLLNTRTYITNTPLLTHMLYGESVQLKNDKLNRTEQWPSGVPADLTMSLKFSGSPIDPNRSADPKDALFLTYYAPDPQGVTGANCLSNNTSTLHKNNGYNGFNNLIYGYILGNNYDIHWYVPPYAFGNGEYCSYKGNTSQYTEADWNTWRPVTLQLAANGEAPDEFWNLPKTRTATTIKTRSPHVGFFSTTQFWGAYPSNAGNQMRAVANQTMIVALGRTFNGTDATTPSRLDALDSVHASPTSTCYGCHRQMDPMRQFFMHDYSRFFQVQDDPNMKAVPGLWVKDGVSQEGSSIYDFADKLAAHPDVAMAWTKKTCAWVNSGPCLDTDPEVQRIAALFTSSNYNFRTMLKAILLSPITTAKSATLTNDELGVVVTMARKQTFCRTLSNRLNIDDICSLKADTNKDGNLGAMKSALAVLPADGYSRGIAEAVSVTNYNLLQRSGLEVVCAYVAGSVVDSGSGALFTSNDPNKAIQAIAQSFLGIPAAQSTPYESILQQHYASAITANGATPTAALRSTFVVACLSPQISMLGQY